MAACLAAAAVTFTHGVSSAQARTFEQITVIADTHLDGGPGTPGNDKVEDFVQKMNDQLAHPEERGAWSRTDLVVVVGDMVAQMNRDEEVPNKETANVRSFTILMNRLDVGWDYALGNHDLKMLGENSAPQPCDWTFKQAKSRENSWLNITSINPKWKRRVASHNSKWVMYLLHSWRKCMVTGSNRRWHGNNQLNWFEDKLAADKAAGKKIIIFQHVAPGNVGSGDWGKDLVDRARFKNDLKIYKGPIELIIVGHGHSWENDDIFSAKVSVREVDSMGDEANRPPGQDTALDSMVIRLRANGTSAAWKVNFPDTQGPRLSNPI
jgi:hypothetical protein